MDIGYWELYATRQRQVKKTRLTRETTNSQKRKGRDLGIRCVVPPSSFPSLPASPHLHNTPIVPGWAGYAFARTLDPARYERIVVSPRSYFVFTPLLASTAVGTLEFRATLESVRRLGNNVAFRQGWADDVDFARKVVRVEENFADGLTSQTILPPPPIEKGAADDGHHHVNVEVPVHPAAHDAAAPAAKGPITEVPYDKLVIAVGAYSQTFGIEGVRQHANFLRDVGDARKIRLRVLSLFEQCASPVMCKC